MLAEVLSVLGLEKYVFTGAVRCFMLEWCTLIILLKRLQCVSICKQNVNLK